MRAECAQIFDRTIAEPPNTRIELIREILFRNSDGYSLQRSGNCRARNELLAIRGNRYVCRSRISRIGAGDYFQGECRIVNIPRERTDLIERRGKRYKPIATDSPVGRLR